VIWLGEEKDVVSKKGGGPIPQMEEKRPIKKRNGFSEKKGESKKHPQPLKWSST